MLHMQMLQNQSLQLKISPELSQAISMLQYSAEELLSFLQEKAEGNPLIEIDKLMDYSFLPSHSSPNTQADPLEVIAAEDIHLTDYLLEQLLFFDLSPDEKRLTTYIIQCLDENGYLREDQSEIALRFHTTQSEVERCLKLIQSLEPAGVGARNLQECLLLQLENIHIRTPLAEHILSTHFEDFAYRKWNKLAKLLEVDIGQIQDLHQMVLTLDPKPGLSYSNQGSPVVMPDYTVQFQNGKLLVTKNGQGNWNISLNKAYETMLRQNKKTEEGSYLRGKYKEFQWIQNGLNTRNNTIHNVVLSLADCQKSFFQKGPEYLKPLTMKELAAHLNVHQSTISRAVRNKYVHTPFGVFELRSFFTGSTQAVNQEEVSSNRVKLLIKQIVETENKYNPLSDQQIAAMLKLKHEINISRRTVANYRDELRILSSSKRKQFAASGAI
ncbi:RNA polymerase factor sigma-54 [Domibacillus sp. 8LH]|uniref:RNA polymerase factor sigma-54 n=1 Tax=Domibacillus sp. 8LH TaxID=3073900 RepID=UPI0031739734